MSAVRIEKLVPGGQGLAAGEDGKKIFFWNALPGEEILEFEILKRKSKYLEAIATKIAEPSEFRVEAKDECFLSTSPWQIVEFSQELLWKKELVLESFQQAKVEVPAEVSKKTTNSVTDGQEYFYRNKMEYALYYDKELGRIFPALHRRGSHAKMALREMSNKNGNSGAEDNLASGTKGRFFAHKTSSIEKPEILEKAFEIVKDLNRRGEEARKYQSLLLRANAQGEISGGLFENGKSHPDFPRLADDLLGQKFSYSPNGFFQVNLPVYELSLKKIAEYLGDTEKVLDLYAGVGSIGLTVATERDLTLVESNGAAYEEMVKNAKRVAGDFTEEGCGNKNKILQSLRNTSEGEKNSGGKKKDKKLYNFGKIRAVLAKSEDVTEFIESDMTVIVDPPRAGLDQKVVERFLVAQPERIIYLSCNPATQARDVKMLEEKYQISLLQPFDFFPHTVHIENLVVMERK